MKEGVTKMTCGACGGENYKIFRDSNDIYVECQKCKAVSGIRAYSSTKLVIDWITGDGCIAPSELKEKKS